MNGEYIPSVVNKYKKNNTSIYLVLSNLYITKSWSAALNVVVLRLCHVNAHVISTFFFPYNFKIVFFQIS